MVGHRGDGRPPADRLAQAASGPAGPRPGDVYELAEAHYRFGTGPLVCRVVRPIGPVLFDGEPWWHIRGHIKHGTLATMDASPQQWQERELHVRASAIPAARRQRG